MVYKSSRLAERVPAEATEAPRVGRRRTREAVLLVGVPRAVVDGDRARDRRVGADRDVEGDPEDGVTTRRWHAARGEVLQWVRPHPNAFSRIASEADVHVSDQADRWCCGPGG